jgi:hypothetical protein
MDNRESELNSGVEGIQESKLRSRPTRAFAKRPRERVTEGAYLPYPPKTVYARSS